MRLLFLDLETTGLGPGHLVLEVAASLVQTEDTGLRVIAEFDAVVHYPERVIRQHIQPGDRVWDMHTSNGLLADVALARKGPRWVACELAGWAVISGAFDRSKEDPVYLAGASVHIDRAWLREFAPAFEGGLHHRHFDISTIREVVKRWGDASLIGEKSEKHRARGDVNTDIQHLRRFIGGVQWR